MFVKDVLERRGPLTIAALSAQAVPATESVKTALGSTSSDFSAFVRKHSGIFEVDGGVMGQNCVFVLSYMVNRQC